MRTSFLGIIVTLGCCSVYAQDYLAGTGTPSFSVPAPTEMGLIDAAAGNVHLEFPMGSFPQRGGTPVDLKLAYDSSIWSIYSDGVSSRWVNNLTDFGYLGIGGWRLVAPGWASLFQFTSGCLFNLLAQEPNGTSHLFHVNLGTGTPSGNGGCSSSSATTYATDASGFQLTASCCSNSAILYPSIYAPDGTCVWASGSNAQGAPGLPCTDANGNYMTGGPPYDGTDTVGRQYFTTGSGTGCTFTGTNGATYPACFYVSNSQGSSSPYTLTYANITLKTHFQQSGVTECTTNCVATVIRSITLPDGSSYSFKYDCDSTTGNAACSSAGGQTAYYGSLKSMTLPTGATITYSYSNFVDATGFVSHRITSKQSPSGTWSYSPTVLNGAPTNTGACAMPSGGYVAGCQQVSVTRPDGSRQVVVFGLNNGIWPFTVTDYDRDGSTVLSTTKNVWDFSHTCTVNLSMCSLFIDNGSVRWTNSDYIQRLQTTVNMPIPGGSRTKKTAYTYGTTTNSNPAAIKEWKYQNGSSPTFPSVADRSTYVNYLSAAHNNVVHPVKITVCNATGSDPSNCVGGGTRVAQTTVTYDTYGSNGTLPLLDVPSVANHDDTNFGVSYTSRGNPTQVTHWVSGTTTLTTTLSYDTAGQVTKMLDPNGNPTTYSYVDNFYSDNGSNPPAVFTPSQPTDAYITAVTDSVGTVSAGYYFGSGSAAFSTDYNGISTYQHYSDAFDRPTEQDLPIGWTLNSYTSPTQVDSYEATGDTTASTACASCAHAQMLLDSLGRVSTETLVNSPSGQATVTHAYDPLSRIASSSHPNFGGSDANNVLEYSAYDGLSRITAITHPDGSAVRTAYGSRAADLAGLAAQLSSTATYGYGYPVVALDETGKQRQEWIDGFGHVIEVDEPSSSSSSPGTGSISINFNSAQVSTTFNPCPQGIVCQPVTAYNSGTISVTIGGCTASASWGPPPPTGTSSTQGIASSLATQFSGASCAVSVSASGSTIMIASVAAGANANLPFTTSSTFNNGTCGSSQCFTGPAFYASPTSGALSGATGGLSSGTAWVTAYTYDALGNLTGVVQGVQTRSYGYDGVGRLTQETTPEAGSTTISYLTSSGALCSGEASNPCSKTDARGLVTTFTYDAGNRLTGKTHTGTTGAESYSYGTSAAAFNVGRLTKMTDPTGWESYAYDKMGRVSTVSKIIGSSTFTIGYQYNSGGQLTRITYPSGRIVQYSYDAVGHLCAVAATTSSCGSYTSPYLTIASSAYDAASRPLSATYGNGVVGSATYIPETFQLSSLSYKKGSTTLFALNYFYQYDGSNCLTGGTRNNGQIQCINDIVQPGRSLSYSYDSVGRVLTAATTGSATYPAWGLRETYDRYGNRTAQTVTAGSGFNSSLTVNSANNRISGYSYDASGNIVGQPSPISSTFSYNAEECMTGYTGNGSTATYSCDGNHLRVKKVVTGANAVTTLYIRSGDEVIAEYDNGAAVNSPTREYIFGESRLATVVGGVAGSGGTITYEHRDHLSPRLFTDTNGNDVGEQGTYPFGEVWYKNNSASQWVYTTYERDQESGVDDALARSYSNDGRFMSPDPLEGVVGDPQSWNRYAYVENDPVNLTDPSGQGFWSDLFFAIADIFIAIFDPPALGPVLEVEAGEQAAEETEKLIEKLLIESGNVLVAVNVGAHTTTKIWVPSGNGTECTGDVCNGPASQGGSGQGGPKSGGDPASQRPGSTNSPEPSPGGPAGRAGGDPSIGSVGGSIWDECGTRCMGALSKAADFSTGAAQVFTLGYLRKWMQNRYPDAEALVNTNSGAYKGGVATGIGISAATISLTAARVFAGLETKIAIHGAHHVFPLLGRAVPHVQIMWWIAGGGATQLFTRGQLFLGSPIRIPLTPWWP